MQVKPEEIPLVARLVRELCGLILDDTKGYLIETRLSALAEEAGCRTFAEFSQKVRLGADRQLASRLVDAITTQETLFFRDQSPFQALEYRILPEIVDATSRAGGARRIRIWSAACSTGQEPYSIGMALADFLPDIRTWDVQIRASDISNEAIRTASAGTYGKLAIDRGMKPDFLRKYFVEQANGWKINDEIRSLVAFERRNLLEPFSTIGPFDVIFCRNVAIYFDLETKRDLFCRLADRLTPSGYLIVGSAESLADLHPRFVPQHHCGAVLYQPNKQPATTKPVARLAGGEGTAKPILGNAPSPALRPASPLPPPVVKPSTVAPSAPAPRTSTATPAARPPAARPPVPATPAVAPLPKVKPAVPTSPAMKPAVPVPAVPVPAERPSTAASSRTAGSTAVLPALGRR